ncbi:MAG: MoxR-like ATPase [Bacteroidia bacterium]|jgi:MoxR-like ATPase
MEEILNNETASAHTSADKVNALVTSIENVIKGQRKQVLNVITCLIAGGHILLEDNPGAGKTVMAKTLASSIGSGDSEKDNSLFKRVQFTPDLLPMDLIGSHIYDDSTKEFVFKRGPLFTNILLADEINRASPKVQSALLECMAENQISVGDTTYKLSDLFFTIATQNPIEMEGTYPLPNAQLDRFYMKVSFGYVSEEVELDIYQNYLGIKKFENTTSPVITEQDVLDLQAQAKKVHLHEELLISVKNIIRGTREHAGISLGASIRSGITFLKCLKAFALVNGRNYVVEDDLKQLAPAILKHRLIFKSRNASKEALEQIVMKEVKRLGKMNLSN